MYYCGNCSFEIDIIIPITFVSSAVLPVVTSVYPEVGQMSYTVNDSEPVTFECTATGIPAPGIEFNLSTIASRVQVGASSSPIELPRVSDGEMVYQVNRTAVIASTVDSDSGVYECIATNDIPGMNSVQFELIVQGMGITYFVSVFMKCSPYIVAPTFTTEPTNLTVIKGSNAVFECQASGVPRPDISWEYYNPVSMNNTAITSGEDYYIVTRNSGERLLTSTLTVLATDTSDFGIYRCVAANVVAMASVNATLTVHGKYYHWRAIYVTLLSSLTMLSPY